MKDVIGFGALNVDLIYEVDSFDFLEKIGLEPGSEIHSDSSKFEKIIEQLQESGSLKSKSGGGSAANTVVALARMGFKTGYIGKVGKDKYGEYLLESMKGVDTTQIKRDQKTGITTVILSKTTSTDRSIIVLPHANDTLTFKEIDLNYANQTKFLHLTSFAGDRPFKAQKELIKHLSDRVKISFDPGEIYVRRGLTSLLPIIKQSYIVFITGKEAELLTGEDFDQAAKELINYGPEIVVCKRGRWGAYIITKEGEVNLPAHEIPEVVDKTGAGDVYAAGFLAGLLKGKSLVDCAIFATKAAAQSITAWGRESYPDKSFLNREL